MDQAVANLSSLRGQVIAEAPQKSIHSFKGRVEMDQLDHLQEPLDAKHLLLRGTLLKNTSWILGLVVYTGAETRMVMNSRAAKAKYPNIEKVINRSMLVVVGAQCIMALISDILYLVTKERFLSLWYLFPAGQFQSILLPEFIGYWLTFFVPLDYQRKNKFDFRTCRKVFVVASESLVNDSQGWHFHQIFTRIPTESSPKLWFPEFSYIFVKMFVSVKHLSWSVEIRFFDQKSRQGYTPTWCLSRCILPWRSATRPRRELFADGNMTLTEYSTNLGGLFH